MVRTAIDKLTHNYLVSKSYLRGGDLGPLGPLGTGKLSRGPGGCLVGLLAIGRVVCGWGIVWGGSPGVRGLRAVCGQHCWELFGIALDLPHRERLFAFTGGAVVFAICFCWGKGLFIGSFFCYPFWGFLTGLRFLRDSSATRL